MTFFRFYKMEDPNTKMEFAVEMRSPCCADKVKKALEGITGIKSISVDVPSQRVIIEGDAVAETVKDTVETKTGMSTVLLGHGSSQQNLGAGVAAISIGNSGVQGLLRFIQSDSETCTIEGTLDKLPTSEPVYLTLHETGDISSGCESCGSLYKSQSQFSGILSQLHPREDKRTEFRFATPNIKLSDMIGHCVVIHKGEKKDIDQNKSERLACGIVARASGLFQNSKRFCACDGVTIWEQKQKERESKIS